MRMQKRKKILRPKVEQKEGLNMDQLCSIQQNHDRNMENITQPKQREKP